ncbi:hypothetical protein BKA62DRAFT_50723 [Auriculariales sp. MPI-PUGE-AT-0066]|nr:hypothetical protein BKA62DRAFT_50723 [Auriculariales sp. MPI-PUGE-AT-0066]
MRQNRRGNIWTSLLPLCPASSLSLARDTRRRSLTIIGGATGRGDGTHMSMWLAMFSFWCWQLAQLSNSSSSTCHVYQPARNGIRESSLPHRDAYRYPKGQVLATDDRPVYAVMQRSPQYLRIVGRVGEPGRFRWCSGNRWCLQAAGSVAGDILHPFLIAADRAGLDSFILRYVFNPDSALPEGRRNETIILLRTDQDSLKSWPKPKLRTCNASCAVPRTSNRTHRPRLADRARHCQLQLGRVCQCVAVG